jgi:hypothetical protein
MKPKILFATFIVFISLSGCTKENLDNIDYFAFGSAHGFCLSNCADFFLIDDGNIYPDDFDYYYNESTLTFKSEPLSIEKYNLAKDLIDRFPNYLINNLNKTFGCPDCADQGGIHIEIKENGQIIRWHFDTNISNLPVQIQDYIQNISSVINQLK